MQGVWNFPKNYGHDFNAVLHYEVKGFQQNGDTMTLRLEMKDDVLFVFIPREGEYEASDLNRNIGRYIDNTDFVIVNLAEADYMGTPILAALLAAHIKVSKRGGDVILTGVPDKLMNLLKITRLDTVFKIIDTDTIALEYIRQK